FLQEILVQRPRHRRSSRRPSLLSDLNRVNVRLGGVGGGQTLWATPSHSCGEGQSVGEVRHPLCPNPGIATRTPQHKKGDISIQLTMGTFLSGLDTSSALSLTRFRL